jgi:S-DNA-T family DNA segregation ATPase FtsK/SpoIIIE
MSAFRQTYVKDPYYQHHTHRIRHESLPEEVARAVVGLVRWLRRHPLGALATLAGFAVVLVLGVERATIATALAATGLFVVRQVRPALYETRIALPVRRLRRWAWYRTNWETLMLGHELHVSVAGRSMIPGLGRRGVVTGVHLDRLTVRPAIGQTVEHFEAKADALATTLAALAVRVRCPRPGLVVLEVLWSDPLAHVVPPAPTPPADAVDLGAVPVGLHEDGTPWTVGLAGSHVLVAGATGAGKGSVIWSLVHSLAAAISVGLVQVWAVDPKGGMELAPGARLWHRFAAGSVAEMVGLLEDAVAVMQERAARYAGATRRHLASVEEPLIVVLVDELAFLTAYAGDRKIREKATQLLSILLSQGRAVGVCVVAALQDPSKDVVAFRQLFPTKIALQLEEASQVDMVLGAGARSRGALCDRIPDATRGVAYVKVDGVREPVRVRAAYPTDDHITAMVDGFAPRADDDQGDGEGIVSPYPFPVPNDDQADDDGAAA